MTLTINIIEQLCRIENLNKQNLEKICGLANIGGDNMKRLKFSNDIQPLSDSDILLFLNGFIRFKRSSGSFTFDVLETFSNNLVLNKLQLAYQLKEKEIIEIFEIGSYPVSRSFVQNIHHATHHERYRVCPDEAFTAFMTGLSIWFNQK